MQFRLPWRKRLPTLLHVTHIKAGSTWLHGLLLKLFGNRVLPRFGSELFSTGEANSAEPRPETPAYLDLFKATPYREGCVYPAMFITYDEFRSRPEFKDARRFVVIRDLRDTLTSHYFSLKGTHQIDKLGRVQSAREYLQSASKDDGFRFLFDRDLERIVQIQQSWLAAGEILLRYEDLIRDDLAILTDLFLNKLDLPVSSRAIQRAVAASRFETVYKRKLGELDEKSHGRQGLPGNWRKHFSREIRAEFHRRAGHVLIDTGYERDASWVDLEKSTTAG